jgi:hypothetical protein
MTSDLRKDAEVVGQPKITLCPVCALDGRKTKLHNGACWMHGQKSLSSYSPKDAHSR